MSWPNHIWACLSPSLSNYQGWKSLNYCNLWLVYNNSRPFPLQPPPNFRNFVLALHVRVANKSVWKHDFSACISLLLVRLAHYWHLSWLYHNIWNFEQAVRWSGKTVWYFVLILHFFLWKENLQGIMNWLVSLFFSCQQLSEQESHNVKNKGNFDMKTFI